MSSDNKGLVPSAWSALLRPRTARPQVSHEALPPDQLWDLHGDSLFALACTVLGDESAALRGVSMGMVDVYCRDDPDPATTPEETPEETLRVAARCVFARCDAMLGGVTTRRTMTLPPLMVWLGELARSQRGALALCVFGGHDYRQAASVLDRPPEVVARLLTSGLQDLGRLAAEDHRKS